MQHNQGESPKICHFKYTPPKFETQKRLIQYKKLIHIQASKDIFTQSATAMVLNVHLLVKYSFNEPQTCKQNLQNLLFQPNLHMTRHLHPLRKLGRGNFCKDFWDC